MPLPKLPYVVIDMNQARRGDVDALIAEFRRSGQLVMLPRVFDYELTKSVNGAVKTILESTEQLLRCPEMVAYARPTYLLRYDERRWRRPLALVDIIDDRATEDFRNAC